MKDNNFKYQLIAIQALDKKYGFCPSPQQVKLLESEGEGTYILFRVSGHEYRLEDGMITNIEEQKKLDEEISTYLEISRMHEKDLADLREAQAKQEKQFATRELMLTEAYDAKRMEIEDWKGRIHLLQTLADGRKEEIERLEAKNAELKKTLHYRELALDKAAKKRDELETKNRQLCNDLAGERCTIRTLEEKLEEFQKLADHWFEEAQKNQAECDEWKKRYESVMKDLTTLDAK